MNRNYMDWIFDGNENWEDYIEYLANRLYLEKCEFDPEQALDDSEAAMNHYRLLAKKAYEDNAKYMARYIRTESIFDFRYKEYILKYFDIAGYTPVISEYRHWDTVKQYISSCYDMNDFKPISMFNPSEDWTLDLTNNTSNPGENTILVSPSDRLKSVSLSLTVNRSDDNFREFLKALSFGTRFYGNAIDTLNKNTTAVIQLKLLPSCTISGIYKLTKHMERFIGH